MNKSATAISVGERGRLVVPAPIRRELGIEAGDVVIARVEGERLVIEPRAAVLARIRQRLASVPADVSLVDELIAQRRVEAERESER